MKKKIDLFVWFFLYNLESQKLKNDEISESQLTVITEI